MRKALTCALGGALLMGLYVVASASTAATDRYRLAGVMVVGADRLGFLELPGGGQLLVRLGSSVDGGKVTEFSAKTRRIAFPDHTVVLALDGLEKTPGAPFPGTVVSSSDTPGAHTREVSVHELRTALAAPAAPGQAPSDARRAVGQRLVEVVQIPPNSRVLAVDEAPVTNATQALLAIQNRLETGQVSALNIQTTQGAERVYLVPNRQ